MFREFAPKGSLKDRIHRKADPKQRWAAKYGFKGEPLKERHVALFGKQVLEAMAYLHTLGGDVEASLPSSSIGMCNNTTHRA